MTSAPISIARRLAAVSVVKYGLPVPAAKITTRPFSRWRIARRRMYGSQTECISMAESTRVLTPSCSSAFCMRERVDHGRQHTHLVGGRAVHAARLVLAAAQDVTGTDHQRELDAERGDIRNFLGDFAERVEVDAVALGGASASPDSFSNTRRKRGPALLLGSASAMTRQNPRKMNTFWQGENRKPEENIALIGFVVVYFHRAENA